MATTTLRRVRERGLCCDWTLDLPRGHAPLQHGDTLAIKCTPSNAARRIVDAGKRRMEGVRHELPLPGFSPTTPPEAGSFVRPKEYVSGSMGSAWPVDGVKNVN